jgi:hypothetical protein
VGLLQSRNRNISGVFCGKKVPPGGGWTTTVVALLFMFDFPTFRQGG